MKEKLQKITRVLRLLFGYGIMITLFVGGFTFLGYVAALIVGGGAATAICDCIYNRIFPVLIYATTSLVLLGLVTMYLSGETALTSEKKKKIHKDSGES